MAEVAALGLRVDGVSNIDQAEKSLSGFSSAATKADKSSSNLTKTSSGLNSAYDRLNGSLSRAAKSMLALGAATVSLAAVSRTLTGFEDSMAQVAAITRATTGELRAMREMAKSLGATTKFSASEAADGIRFLGMAGFSASESLASIPAVLNLATASAMGLADAADIATNIMSGFGIQAQNAANVADVLAAASSRSNTSVQQLGGAMSTVAPISAALGISLEDTAAAIGTLSDAGIQGERAGTAMRGALASLAGPTTQAQKTLKELGLTVQEVNPQTNDLATVFGRLNEAGLNTAQAMTIFGREAASGALVLTQAAGRVGEFGDELRNAAGEAQRMADIMADSLAGDFKNLQSSIEGIIIAMGEAGLIAIMRSVIQLGTELIRSITNVVNGFGRVAGYVGSALEPALNALSHILTTVARNADAIVVAMAAMYAPAVLGGIATLTKAIGVGLVGAVNALTAAMMANPIGFLIRVLATATAAIFVFRDDVNRIFGIKIPSSFREMALAAAGVMDSMIAGFTGNVAAIWSLFVTLGTNIWTFFENIFDQILQDASTWVNNIAKELNNLPFVNINIGEPYKAGDPKEYLKFSEEMEKAFESGQKFLGLREKLALSFAEDDLWAAGAQAAEEYSKVINEIAGGGGEGGGNGDGLPGATDALRKWLAESKNATASAKLMTAAYLQGGKAIAAATRQLQIEQQVLEHGESARNAVTAAIKAQTAALERQDIAKQINELREQNKAAKDYLAVLAAQSRGYQQGRQALAAFNREQSQAAILAGKTADEVADLVAQYDRLFVESQAIQDETSAMNELNSLVESTRTSQEKYNIELQRLVALRPYAQTAEQAEALERAIGDLQRENNVWLTFTQDALERINESFANMWKDAFEGSRSALEGMKRGFRQMLAEMAHAAITQPIMISVGNALMGTNNRGGVGGGGGIFGALNTARSGMTAGGSLGKAATWLGQKVGSEALTSFGLGLSGTTAATGIASIGTSLGASLGASIGTSTAAMASTTFSASLSGGAGASMAATAGASGAAGAGAAFGAALPWIGGALAIGSLLAGGFGNAPEKRFGGGYSWTPGHDAWYHGGPSGKPTPEEDKLIGGMVQSTAESLQSLFDRVGAAITVTEFLGGAESSEKGRGGTFSGGTLSIDGETIDFGTRRKGTGFGGTSGTLEQMIENLGVDLSQTYLEGLQAGASKLPSVIQEMIDGIVPSNLGAEQSNALAQQIQLVIEQVSAFQLAVESLPFANLRDLSFDAAANLISFAGGLENLDAGMTSYFQLFHSEAEQLEWAAERMGAAFAEVGLEMPDITQGAEAAKWAYRELRESLDLTTEEGQRMSAMLFMNAQGFHELVTGMDELNNAVVETARSAADIARERESLERQWLSMVGDTAELRRRDLDVLHESNREMQKRIWAEQEAQAVIARAQEAARAVEQERYDLEAQLLQLQGDTVALRARELDALNPLNRGLQQQIWTLQDAAAAQQAYERSIQSVTGSLAGIRETVLLDQLGSDDARYDYFKQQADGLARLLPQLTDESAITQTISQIASITGRAYGLLDGEQKQAMGGEFLDYIDRTETIATRQIQAIQEGQRQAAQEQAEATAKAVAHEVGRIANAIIKSVEGMPASTANAIRNAVAQNTGQRTTQYREVEFGAEVNA